MAGFDDVLDMESGGKRRIKDDLKCEQLSPTVDKAKMKTHCRVKARHETVLVLVVAQ